MTGEEKNLASIAFTVDPAGSQARKPCGESKGPDVILERSSVLNESGFLAQT